MVISPPPHLGLHVNNGRTDISAQQFTVYSVALYSLFDFVQIGENHKKVTLNEK